MTNLNLTQFDQAALLFFVLASVGLIRERKILPFVIVALGTLLNGMLAAVLLCGLILWHRMDSGCLKWVQLKDTFGFLLILMASILPAPFQEFGIIKGNVSNISAMPVDGKFIVDVELPNGNKTTYNRELPRGVELQGYADIITKDVNLLQKFFEPFRSLKNNQ